MADIYVKLSELSRPSTPVNDSDVVFISQLNNTENVSSAMSISDLRGLLNFENAYDTTVAGLAATTANQIFYVYTDGQKLSVNPYYNRNGIAEAIVDSNSNKLVYSTLAFLQQWFTYYGYSLIKEVPSFAALRTLPVLVEGQKVKLKSYYADGNTGGGEFVGHIGTKTDDGGVIASGSGYYWERVVNNNSIDIFSFGSLDNTVAGNELIDNKTFIQAAINYATAQYSAKQSIFGVYVPSGIFKVRSFTFKPSGTSTAFGIMSIQLKDGVRLFGEGTIMAFESMYGTGAFYRVIGSDSNAKISDASIEGITVDGQRATQIASNQCSNILIEAAANIRIRNVRAINANGNGIMVRGDTTTPCSNVIINDCFVDNVSMIGIQVSQFDGISISSNTISNTGNNGIDLYGDTGVNASNSNGNNFSIVGNTLKNIGVGGIFPETVANGTITGNSIYNCREGIHSNRIRSVPKNIAITGNTITKSSVGGIIITGDQEGINITGNTVSDWTGAGFCFGTSLGGNVSNIFATSNMFLPTDPTVTVVSVKAGIVSRIEMSGNFIRNNVGVPADNFVTYSYTTISGVNIGSWAVTASGRSTGTQMYRQGTFTPAVKGATTAGTYTYTTQSGSFVRVGNLVNFQAKVVWTAGTGTGQLKMTGLPAVASANIAQPQLNTFFTGLALTAYGQEIVSNLSTTLSELAVVTRQQGSGTTSIVLADSVSSGTLWVSGFYFVD